MKVAGLPFTVLSSAQFYPGSAIGWMYDFSTFASIMLGLQGTTTVGMFKSSGSGQAQLLNTDIGDDCVLAATLVYHV